MTNSILVELPSGGKVMFAANETLGPVRGMQEVSAGQIVPSVSKDAFASALNVLGELAECLGQSITRITKVPKKAELSFTASFSPKLNLWVVAGEGKGEIAVKLTWEN